MSSPELFIHFNHNFQTIVDLAAKPFATPLKIEVISIYKKQLEERIEEQLSKNESIKAILILIFTILLIYCFLFLLAGFEPFYFAWVHLMVILISFLYWGKIVRLLTKKKINNKLYRSFYNKYIKL